MAFLVVLESTTPAERVAFILHDVFRYPFAEVAEIVGRTPAACRQLASSARRRVRDSRAPTTQPSPQQASLVREFKRAWEAKDIDALVVLLDPGVAASADSGGLARTVPLPVAGAARLARAPVGLVVRPGAPTIEERHVNGQPGLVAQQDGAIVTVYAFGIDGERITHIWAVRNPEKLRPWTGGVLSGV
ncbi:sigma factor-like helix-turn-helix DNA-binding protein [Streptomyces sp. NBC_01013]|uniref:sigma factor-like helix-turn-helix DNA-binding protein n=1 Tax=Streptomyces sp. NBC_01013 TaxID=2903718 RepID=UPI00386949BA